MKRKTDNFSKFFNRKSNSAIKEAIKQEKKAEKKARKEAIERHFEKKREAKAAREGFNQAESTGGKFNPGKSSSFQAGRKHSGNPPRDAHSTPGKDSGAIQPKKNQFSGKAHEASGKFQAPGSAGKNQAPDKFSPAGKHPASQEAQHAHNPGNAQASGDLMPLNKYIAHSGICSRRDAAELIRQGKVAVNGQLVTEPGTKVAPADYVKVNGKKVTITHDLVYILLNKPKDYITTTDDPQGRKTVLDLIRRATEERVYPVGRLDRNTSGVLLLTNDGELAQKLAHPKHEIKKIYHVTLDKVLTKGDFDKIINGEVILEDGPAFVDVIAYADSRDKTQVGLEIHSGRNRIVRRIFEHLGYDVRGLDRVMYAGLTKKNVQRGKWRLLTEKEIRILKYLNSSFKRTPSTAGAGEQDFEKQDRKVAPKGKQNKAPKFDAAEDLDDPDELLIEKKQNPGKFNTGSPAKAKAKGPYIAKGERSFVAKGERPFASGRNQAAAGNNQASAGRNQASAGDSRAAGADRPFRDRKPAAASRKPAPSGRNQAIASHNQAPGRRPAPSGRDNRSTTDRSQASGRNQAPGSGRKPSTAGRGKAKPGRNQAAPGGRPARSKGRNAK